MITTTKVMVTTTTIMLTTTASPAPRLRKRTKGAGTWLALAVGVVPCTGALLVLLFGVANDLLFPAILMVAAISAGMASRCPASACSPSSAGAWPSAG